MRTTAMSAFSESHYFFVCFRSRGDDLRPRFPEGSDLLPLFRKILRNSLFESKVESQGESQGRTKPKSTRYTTHILDCYPCQAITNIVGKKTIDLSYLIKNFNNKEIAVVDVFSDNIQYEFTEPWVLELEESRNK